MNIIPRDCEFTWEFRPLPGEDTAAISGRIERFIATDLLPRLRKVHPDADVVTRALASIPGLVAQAGSPAEALARQLTGANHSTVVAYGTEAGLFQGAGIPAVICGPGSMEQGHQPNEFITLEQIEAGTAFQRRLADWACR
jgi:acetylornithine deacetylase